jgi:mono/diheme cytochrome c family protein
MNRIIVVVALALAGYAQNARSVSDGVYTAAQQQRGEAIYTRECSTCHGERLKGGEGSPPLTGAEFDANWNDKTIADLFDKIRQTMPAPPEQPGKLTPQQTADVIAHILSVDGFPAGATELPADVDQLKRIRLTAGK